jgi:hypothetical protein
MGRDGRHDRSAFAHWRKACVTAAGRVVSPGLTAQDQQRGKAPGETPDVQPCCNGSLQASKAIGSWLYTIGKKPHLLPGAARAPLGQQHSSGSTARLPASLVLAARSRRRRSAHRTEDVLFPRCPPSLVIACELERAAADHEGTTRTNGQCRLETMLLRAGLRRCTASTLDLVRREPFKSALVVTTVKTVAADLLVQLAVQKQEWDPRRTALFGAFGLIYQGAAQYVVVNIVIERTVNALFPGQTTRAVVAKCAAMNGLADPLLFLPTFYVFKETIHRARHMPDFSTVRRPLQQRVYMPLATRTQTEPVLRRCLAPSRSIDRTA